MWREPQGSAAAFPIDQIFSAPSTAIPTLIPQVDEKGRRVFRLRADPPPEEWQPCRLRTTVSCSEDLWNVLVKSPHATLAVPVRGRRCCCNSHWEGVCAN